MTDEEAISECQRWLDHLENRRCRSREMQRLAILAKTEPTLALKQLSALRETTVYDGTKLEIAVRHLISRIEK